MAELVSTEESTGDAGMTTKVNPLARPGDVGWGELLAPPLTRSEVPHAAPNSTVAAIATLSLNRRRFLISRPRFPPSLAITRGKFARSSPCARQAALSPTLVSYRNRLRRPGSADRTEPPPRPARPARHFPRLALAANKAEVVRLGRRRFHLSRRLPGTRPVGVGNRPSWPRCSEQAARRHRDRSSPFGPLLGPGPSLGGPMDDGAYQAASGHGKSQRC